MKLFLTIVAFVAVSAKSLDHSGPNLPKIGRIIGGQEAAPNSIPYQAFLRLTTSSGTSIVGGSLISPNYILSAASVLYRATSVDVYLGKHNITIVEEHEVQITSTNIIIHDKWDANTMNHDIALIKLPEPIDCTAKISPVTLPKYSDVGYDYINDEATISGWGKTSSTSQASQVLRYLDVQIFENMFCQMIFPGYVHQSLCTRGDGLHAKGFCVGDSGSPLVIDGVQIGIASLTSWYSCEEGWPSVYTRMWSYLDWIADNTDVVIEA